VTSWAAGVDLLVVGSGVAGLTAALQASSLGLRTLVVTKGEAGDGNTRWAQGGIATASRVGTVGSHEGHTVVSHDGGTVASRDGRTVVSHDGGTVVSRDGGTVRQHAADTLLAGAGLCEEAAVWSILAGGPAAVAALRQRGAVFDRAADGSLARTREGGHSAFRVIHAGGDATGAEIERALLDAARGVPILEHHMALDVLLTDEGAAAGLLVLGPEGTVGRLRAQAVLLATGGFGQLYAATTNPAGATGDGLALALRAGASAKDLEFVQFHPTVLYTGPGARGRRPLVSEAVRGEGAVLVDATGAPVMAGVHPLADLAPRDVVAAAITARMERTGQDHVYLDATGLVGFGTRFPTVAAACREAGIEPSREPIPVAPAAHYACGGVESTVDGRTEVTGLYAAGEVARTGLHGANRLASNSLIEGLVLGARAAQAVAADLAAGRLAHRAAPVRPAGGALPVADRDVLQRGMSQFAGVGRDGGGLDMAARLIERSVTGVRVETAAGGDSAMVSSAVEGAVTRAVEGAAASAAAAEDAALTMAALAVLAAASTRTESRGCHVRTDFPGRDDAAWRRSLTVSLGGDGRPVTRVELAIGGAA
jgi:L-aspartate oxidase